MLDATVPLPESRSRDFLPLARRFIAGLRTKKYISLSLIHEASLEPIGHPTKFSRALAQALTIAHTTPLRSLRTSAPLR
jgi:hypothetical protein